ncbi:MAG: beta-lactamase family protein [Spirochaetales bacterium]|nr:beta-lactamase family protein [Spirochaetales bacterium]
MKIMITGIIIMACIIGLFFLLNKLGSRPMSRIEVRDKIDKLLAKTIEKNETITGALLLIDSAQKDYKEVFALGTVGQKPVKSDQPFHIASAGKSFTAALAGILIDDGALSLEDRVDHYLDAGVTGDLFKIAGKDYSDQVTVRNLLNHTSGVADYFSDPVHDSKPMSELILSEPERFWTPLDLIDFTRNYQNPVGKPGETYHYSDTGYILLGLIIEQISGKPFHEMLKEKIFIPLSMDDTYLMFYAEPKNGKREISDIWFEGVRINEYNSLSIDWAGGGIISTLPDLSHFIRALNKYEIVSEETMNLLYSFDHKFMRGIHYGNGFMEFHFEEYFPLLANLPHFRGHMGVLGTQMLYDRNADTVYICSFGSTDAPSISVQSMIKIVGYILRIRE